MRTRLYRDNPPIYDEDVGSSYVAFRLDKKTGKGKDAPLTLKFASTTLPMAAVPRGCHATPIESLTN